MKQLFKNETATTLFFEDETTLEDISDWISINIHTGNDIFNLNEAHSSKVKIFDNVIIISGDEDWIEITLEKITPIVI